MRIYTFDFSVHKSINFSHVLPDNKKVKTMTPQFSLSFRKSMPHTKNTLNLEKWQYFKMKTFSFLV